MSGTSPETVREILLVEDSTADARLMVEASKTHALPCRICHARDGGEALRMLRRSLEDGGAPLPELVLIDLNMPRMDGYELLLRIRDEPRFDHVSAIILTTSDAPVDRNVCHLLGAEDYWIKPMDFDAFGDLMRRIRAVLRAGRRAAGAKENP